MPIHKRTNIKRSAHADHVAYHIGMPESKIGRVKSTEACTAHYYFGDSVFMTDTINYFVTNKFIVPKVIFNPFCGMHLFIVPAMFINTVDTINFDFSGIDKMRYRINEFKIPAFKIPSHCRGENNDRSPVMPVNQHFKVFT